MPAISDGVFFISHDTCVVCRADGVVLLHRVNESGDAIVDTIALDRQAILNLEHFANKAIDVPQEGAA